MIHLKIEMNFLNLHSCQPNLEIVLFMNDGNNRRDNELFVDV